ncbi:MAG: hypothetical protein J0H14_26055 [Alphaproteobacteria bacterium]|nr:hypothetical protein [Rhodospirillales bacterium]MBN9564162.1 hypothetical protein [Alphaproteobacteria bacterium]
MSGQQTRGADEKRLDRTIEETFPASDPPANTPVKGTRKAERAEAERNDAKAGDQKAQRNDPHGAGPSNPASKEQPAGAPTSDRHETETAAGDHPHRRK